MRLSRAFYLRSTLQVARDLIGKCIVTNIKGKKTSGMIVEVEAYDGDIDPACHAYRNRSERTEVMFWKGGHCYVYFIYGNHFCLNVVTEREGRGCAALIRASQPLEAIELQRSRRGKRGYNLSNGPGKLCQALGVTKALWGQDFTKSKKIWIEHYQTPKPSQIATSTRIGISKAKSHPWRFYLKNNPWVSSR